MNSVILIITVLFGMLLVPAIEMRRKRCHKRPTVVECPDPIARTCANNWNMAVTTKDKLVGGTGILTCSAGYSLVGNASITCLESGQWSPRIAICVPDDLDKAYVRAFRGSTYTIDDTEKTYDEAKVAFFQLVVVCVRAAYIGLESKNGTNYEWQSQNTTESNMFDDWFEGNPDEIAVGSCVAIDRMKHAKWVDESSDVCKFFPIPFICEFR